MPTLHVLCCIHVLSFTIIHGNAQNLWKDDARDDYNVVMKCDEPNECIPTQAIYRSPRLILSTEIFKDHKFWLQIVQYSTYIVLTLTNNRNLNEYKNISIPTHDDNNLYQLLPANEFIKFIESSLNESISQITSTLTKQSDDTLILKIEVRYDVLQRDIILAFTKQNENEMNFMNKLLQKFENDIKIMNDKIDAMSKEIERLKLQKESIRDIPSGVIMIFHGAIDNIPKGYVLCDGNNGTPDLRDKFIIGAGGKYKGGETGGSLYHKHSAGVSSENIMTEMVEVKVGGPGGKGRRHRHHDHHGPRKQMISTVADSNGHEHEVVLDDGENLPPFYSMVFIMKVS